MPKLQESPKEKPPVPPPLKDEVKDRILRGDIGTEQHIILTCFRFLPVEIVKTSLKNICVLLVNRRKLDF